jgi:hypothetical protein
MTMNVIRCSNGLSSLCQASTVTGTQTPRLSKTSASGFFAAMHSPAGSSAGDRMSRGPDQGCGVNTWPRVLGLYDTPPVIG